jgi:AcrR family transcriptional regulator
MQHKSPPQLPCKGYHHGDLRNALIVAAAELIEEKGSLDFTMIDAARRAGVSSAAPYRHFRSRDELLQAVSELAFMGLDVISRQVAATLPPGSSESIIAQGKAYIGYLLAKPAFYDLMWGDLGLRGKNPEDPELKTSGFYTLVDAVRGWCEHRGIAHFNPLELAVKIWAIAHGLACLAMNDNIGTFVPEADIYTLFESSVNTFLEGLSGDAGSR